MDEVPCRKSIANPSCLETEIRASYNDKHHCTYICCCHNSLCCNTLQEIIRTNIIRSALHRQTRDLQSQVISVQDHGILFYKISSIPPWSPCIKVQWQSKLKLLHMDQQQYQVQVESVELETKATDRCHRTLRPENMKRYHKSYFGFRDQKLSVNHCNNCVKSWKKFTVPNLEIFHVQQLSHQVYIPESKPNQPTKQHWIQAVRELGCENEEHNHN